MPGLVTPGGRSGPLILPKASVEHIDCLKDTVRWVHGLDADTPVVVQQLACAEPGCPPVETVVAVLGHPRRVWKLSKATTDVSPTELRTIIAHQPDGGTHADHN